MSCLDLIFSQTASDSSGDNPMEDVEAGIARAPLSTVDQKKERKMPLAANILALPSFPPIAPEEEPTAAAVAGDEQARPGAAAAKAVVEDVEPAATGAVGVPRSSRRVSWVDGDDTVAAAPPLSRQIMKSISVPAILAEAPSGDRLSAPANLEGVAGEEGVGVGGRLLQGNSRGYGKGHVSSGLGHRNVVSLGGRVERAARKGHSRRKTIAGSIDGGVYQTEEEQEIMESVREELLSFCFVAFVLLYLSCNMKFCSFSFFLSFFVCLLVCFYSLFWVLFLLCCFCFRRVLRCTATTFMYY